MFVKHEPLPRPQPRACYLFIVDMKIFIFSLFCLSSLILSEASLKYDYSASTECKPVPETALYNGGIIDGNKLFETPINSTSFTFSTLAPNTIYAFSAWVKITGADSTLIKFQISTDNVNFNCTGTVLARNGCWSFFKGGFMTESLTYTNAQIFLTNGDGKQVKVSIASASVQPFTFQEWEENQQQIINTERKRTAIFHVYDVNGMKVQNADVVVTQASREFPFGSVISDFILENKKYQDWFLERFNTAVFENELKWYATEVDQGNVNYTVPDRMIQLLRSKQISIRGHNVLWDNPNMLQSWVGNLSLPDLRTAMNSRIHSVMERYRDEFINWDVNNEMLPFHFYEDKFGPNASIDIFRTAQELDPKAGLYMNEYNTLETCDSDCAVDKYVLRLRELMNNGITNLGIGLQSHFGVPNPALIRGVLDKLATLGLPIWMTEVDISTKHGLDQQAKYLELVMREGYSHPKVDGIMLWAGLHSNYDGCYRMCLTDYNITNNPTGDTFDRLMNEWETKMIQGKTDERGNFDFSGFLGDYDVTVAYNNKSIKTRLSLSHGKENKHLNIYL